MEYSEFEQLLTTAYQIFEHIKTSVFDVDICKFQKSIAAHTLTPPRKMLQIEKMAKKNASTLAVQFDKDGDGVISYQEFQAIAEYIKEEFEKITPVVTIGY
eukprot:UN04612